MLKKLTVLIFISVSCLAHAKDRKISLKENLTAFISADGMQVKFKDQELFTSKHRGVLIKEKFREEGKTAIVLELKGPASCPADYRIVLFKSGNATPQVSDEFGNCAKNPEFSKLGNDIWIDFPSFKKSETSQFVFNFDEGVVKITKGPGVPTDR